MIDMSEETEKFGRETAESAISYEQAQSFIKMMMKMQEDEKKEDGKK